VGGQRRWLRPKVGGDECADVVKLRTRAVLLEVVERSEVLGRWWSTVSFSRTVTMTKEVDLVDIVAIGSSSKVLLHLQRKTVVWSIDSNDDGGGRRRQANVGGSGEWSRAECARGGREMGEGLLWRRPHVGIRLWTTWDDGGNQRRPM
jgi:hypothetical protein